ncbi:MAG: DUF2452 domain-containing protein [bacterium]|nr:DUF2452 domain-containing protein [bacterium]
MERPQHNKNEAIVENKHTTAYPTRTMDPPFSLVERAQEIERAEESIQSHVHGKLDLIVKQIRALKAEARTIMDAARRDLELHQVKCNFEKLVGQPIHLYRRPDYSLYFSLLSPADWKQQPPNEFQGSFQMGIDRSFEALDPLARAFGQSAESDPDSAGDSDAANA